MPIVPSAVPFGLFAPSLVVAIAIGSLVNRTTGVLNPFPALVRTCATFLVETTPFKSQILRLNSTLTVLIVLLMALKSLITIESFPVTDVSLSWKELTILRFCVLFAET